MGRKVRIFLFQDELGGFNFILFFTFPPFYRPQLHLLGRFRLPALERSLYRGSIDRPVRCVAQTF